MRWEVPNRRCGCRNQWGRIPSSETLFKTPFEPTIAVFTAPASIRIPTTTTKDRKSSRSGKGPGKIHRESADGIVEKVDSHRIGDNHHCEECHPRSENKTVSKN